MACVGQVWSNLITAGCLKSGLVRCLNNRKKPLSAQDVFVSDHCMLPCYFYYNWCYNVALLDCFYYYQTKIGRDHLCRVEIMGSRFLSDVTRLIKS